jgi:predicted DNA-binding antitoxin AbrB/MazE fold protein
MIVKAIYQNNLLRPLEALDLKEGEEVDIEIKKKSIFGYLKGWKVDPQALKDELREIDG